MNTIHTDAERESVTRSKWGEATDEPACWNARPIDCQYAAARRVALRSSRNRGAEK
jgi:hypothetical protein